ncbi:radical SAM family uncharacterized protein [Longilinea arvoryzae]|uniref:Radical SAM family uncharacterized protein n=1 Tax=Longilinea arvoryzae TaxID=360412 RepID=A0A0S7BG88_9CHLR|nr:TIGR03960 family B12-binding radical SAM protein [Longilinea arvoryzae]GAP14589.1 radical SAM family uncharacterized protein [Longilinea arvoryzae]
MLTPEEINLRLERVLPLVQKPGRYVGGEYNQVRKDWNAIETRVALAFPDIYDIGLPNLGLAIFYQQLNARPDVLAERVYCPWVDMEAFMRRDQIPLFSIENQRPVAEFDILAVTLPYETLYTNTLNLLDLAGIPLKSQDRTRRHPLVIAGGHACYNPEPMADFIDAFVIGEGEEVFEDVVNAYQAWKRANRERSELLLSLAGIPGVYVPSLYRPHYQADGTIEGIERLHPAAPEKITKRILAKLPPAPARFLVPNIEVVHNRISVEIMRGCTRGCRFCHAGMINRPVRERSIEEIVETLQKALDSTGFEEIALLSLSSSDYSHITELIDAVTTRFAGRNLVISLPSLRIESFSVDLMEKLKGSRQGGFTIAPEAATERMRNIINKPISTQQLLDTVRAIYSRGWPTIKLYFMIGHPDETLEDVQAIADLCKAVLAEGRKTIGGRAQVHAGVSTFIPKPHTPFQWVPADSVEQIAAKQALLKHELRGPNIKLNWSDPRDTMLEAFLSRGDRRLGEVILGAWQRGTKFDAWQDQVNHAAWQEAFAVVGLSPEFYVHRARFVDEIFPWDHINPAVKKSYLLEEYRNSQQGVLRGDCRQQCYACGILPTFNDLRRSNPGEYWKCPDVSRARASLPADERSV